MHNKISVVSALSSVLYTTALVAGCALDKAAIADDSAATNPVAGPTLHAKAAADASNGESPYTLHLMYTGEEWENNGGLKDGSVYMQNVYASMHIDADKAFGWNGASFEVSGFYNTAHSLDTGLVGGYADESVIDTGGTQMIRLYEAYYDQQIGHNTDILLGLHDLETEFGSTKPMGLFMGGSYAWTSTLDRSGPAGNPSTYPTTAPVFRIKEKIDDHWSAQAAVADGESDSVKYPKESTINFNRNYGAFLIGEIDYRTSNRTKLMAGYWGYTGKFDDLSSTDAGGTAQRQVAARIPIVQVLHLEGKHTYNNK